MAHRILNPVQGMSTLASMNIDRELESPLLGARDLIVECRELLRGERTRLTPHDEYVRQRLAYWRARAEQPAASDELAA